MQKQTSIFSSNFLVRICRESQVVKMRKGRPYIISSVEVLLPIFPGFYTQGFTLPWGRSDGYVKRES